MNYNQYTEVRYEILGIKKLKPIEKNYYLSVILQLTENMCMFLSCHVRVSE